MDQQNDRNTGAPSTDTTSALFVSARKKQLEQQEADRQAQERETQRLAAEAEVRRLEQEVAERKRRAQEEAVRVEQEAANRKAQQEAQRAEFEAAQRRVQSESGAPQGRQYSAAPAAAPSPKRTGTVAAANVGSLLQNKKMLLIGGAAVLLIIAIVLIVVLSSGGAQSFNPKNFTKEISSRDGYTINYPDDWSGEMLLQDGLGLFLESKDGQNQLAVADMTSGLNTAVANGTDAITAAENLLYDIAGVFAAGNTITDMEPQLQKSGITISGTAEFHFENNGVSMLGVAKIESISDARTYITAYSVPDDKNAKNSLALCEAILGTLMIGDPPSDEPDVVLSDAYWEGDDRFFAFSNELTGLACYLPLELEGLEDPYEGDEITPPGVSFQDKLILLNYTEIYQSVVVESGASLEDLTNGFIDRMFYDSMGEEGVLSVSVGDAYMDDYGAPRVDFYIQLESNFISGILRVNEYEGTCIVAMGNDLTDSQQEYFDVMASSAIVSVG